jgi:UrcA family protein
MSKLVLAAAAALALSTPAMAQSVDRDSPTQSVSTRGVDFNDQAQVRHFYARLRDAARHVCENDPNHIAVAVDQSCVRANVSDAVKQVNAPKLTAMLTNTYGPERAATAFATDAR